ncbi:mitochondrial outer membrane protein porin of 34 kDa-like [Pistacia vera]|uniref:mitochondrial outer membrane protein porin of 34 kDa-like n=1 Tax=Pistacia vera TaxID=55513 RepID=UPI0012630428|nr:mitochondrial outer membrane protein porin of 34 kDa-like [Pistacia vera]
MSSSPGLYFHIGKKARDLLYKGYAQQPPFHFSYQWVDWNVDLSCQMESIVPGLQTALRFTIPDSGKVELRFLHDYVGITAGSGLKMSNHHSIGNEPSIGLDPVVNFSGVIGTDLVSLGTDIAFDMSASTFNKINAGLTFNSPFLVASLTLNDKLDTLKASYYQPLNPLSRSAIAAELKHSFFIERTTILTVGGQHELFPSTLVKARMDSNGKVGALIQQGFWQKFFLSIAGEFDFKDNDRRRPKIGLSAALAP